MCSFLTNDKDFEYISKMGNKLTPFNIAIGDPYIYCITPHFKFIKKDQNVESEILYTNESSVNLFHYHLSNCGKDFFKELRLYKIHSNYD